MDVPKLVDKIVQQEKWNDLLQILILIEPIQNIIGFEGILDITNQNRLNFIVFIKGSGAGHFSRRLSRIAIG